ncbi:helix-turn-helix domain-containing protein [Polaromonas jejuensis]|uniref:Helix-turn-helix domain-containing protein n=1 Tax=Polaromonas jejuensis TaxID=457502 RepID=A0ABW0QA40_9BURK
MSRCKIDSIISITEITGVCNLSCSYSIHAFRGTTSKMRHQRRIAQQLERVRSLLAEFERLLADVAAACGFANQSHFTRVFTRCTRTPPGNWRQRMQVGD